MYRVKRLYILAGVLALTCAAAVWALHQEERQEQIASSGETVLEIDPDTVRSLSWEYDGETLSFHRDGPWIYDSDEAFPVSGDSMQELLETFRSFRAAFVITQPEDLSQYGLDNPVCTIEMTTEDQTYVIQLGDYSTMDQQRYVSTGDGKVYLAVADPLDTFAAELSDFIEHDETPNWNQVTRLTVSGSVEESLFYQKDNSSSYSAIDVYFTQRGGEILPLDTDRVESYLDALKYLGLTDYVTYHATDQELSAYGLDNPELTITAEYTCENETGEAASGTFVLHISRDPQEREAAKTAEKPEDDLSEITAYARVGDSQIVYQISGEEYETLMTASYNDLRHTQVFWADFDGVSQLDIALDGVDYTITSKGDGEDRLWFYGDEELDITNLQRALEGVTAVEFTDEAAKSRQAIELTVHLDSEAFPQVQMQFYRYDGASCLAVVDGEPVSLVARSAVVDLMEAVRAIVLNETEVT